MAVLIYHRPAHLTTCHCGCILSIYLLQRNQVKLAPTPQLISISHALIRFLHSISENIKKRKRTHTKNSWRDVDSPHQFRFWMHRCEMMHNSLDILSTWWTRLSKRTTSHMQMQSLLKVKTNEWKKKIENIIKGKRKKWGEGGKEWKQKIKNANDDGKAYQMRSASDYLMSTASLLFYFFFFLFLLSCRVCTISLFKTILTHSFSFFLFFPVGSPPPYTTVRSLHIFSFVCPPLIICAPSHGTWPDWPTGSSQQHTAEKLGLENASDLLYTHSSSRHPV